jgi:hypothetical protein
MCVWRYSCLNVTHKKPYKIYEGKTDDLLMAFIGYVNELNKLQQFKVSVQKSDPYAPTSNSCIFTLIENWTHVYMNLFESICMSRVWNLTAPMHLDLKAGPLCPMSNQGSLEALL